MRRAAPAAQDLARRLLAYEAGVSQRPEARVEAAPPAVDKLRFHLSKLIGPAGFQAFLDRSLGLARAEFPWLAEVQVEPDGALKGLREVVEGRDPAEAAAGVTAVLAHFLGLMVSFIGDPLTLRLMRAVWPELSLSDAGSGEAGTGAEEARR